MTRAKLNRLQGDTPTTRANLKSAAAQLEHCAAFPEVQNANNLYYHAGSCYERAGMMVQASTAYVKAGIYDRVVQILFDDGDMPNAVKFLMETQKYLDTKQFLSWRDEARIHFFGLHNYSTSKLSVLFDSVDEQVAYCRTHHQKLHLKRTLGINLRYDELAAQYLEENKLIRGADCYIKAYKQHYNSASMVNAVRLLAKHLKSTFSAIQESSSPKCKVSRDLPTQERLHTDSPKIDLYVDRRNTDVAVTPKQPPLCTNKSLGIMATYLVTTVTKCFQGKPLEIVLDYLAVWRSFKVIVLELINQSSSRTPALVQALLGHSQGNNLTASNVFRDWPVHPNDTKSGVYLGTSTYDSTQDFTTIFRRDLLKRTYAMMNLLNSVALVSTWAQSQRFNPSTLPGSSHYKQADEHVAYDRSFAIRFHLLCRILLVLDATVYDEKVEDYTTSEQQWLLRIFGTLYSIDGKIGCFAILQEVSDWEAISVWLVDWLTRGWEQLCSTDMSNTPITQFLVHFLVQPLLLKQSSLTELPVNTQLTSSQNLAFINHFVIPLQDFFTRQGYNCFERAIMAAERILEQKHSVDAVVFIQFIKRITWELMLHMTHYYSEAFDRLLLPYSWMRALARKYPSAPGLTNVLPGFELPSLITRISWDLRSGEQSDVGRWNFDEHGNSGISRACLVEVLNMRLCWCAALLSIHMSNYLECTEVDWKLLNYLSDDEGSALYAGRGKAGATRYHAFLEVEDRESCLAILCKTFQHEPLVLLRNSVRNHPAAGHAAVRQVYRNDPASLVTILEGIMRGHNRLDVSAEIRGKDRVSGRETDSRVRRLPAVGFVSTD